MGDFFFALISVSLWQFLGRRAFGHSVNVLSHGQRLYCRTAQDGISKGVCCWANNAAVEYTQHFVAHGSGFETLV